MEAEFVPPVGGDEPDTEVSAQPAQPAQPAPSAPPAVLDADAGAAPASPALPAPVAQPAHHARTARLGRWLPSTRQLADAARLRLAAALGPDHEGSPFVPGLHTSMRQAFGLIVLVGLGAGLSRLIWQWATLAHLHTVAPLLRLNAWVGWAGARAVDPAPWMLMDQQIAGLSPRAPDWVAAGLNAVGVWLSLPMQLLTLWIVYGLLMLAVAKVLGGAATLPRFYAALGYAVLPALLLLLWPLPLLGPIAAALAVLLAIVMSHNAVRAATGLRGAYPFIIVALPAVVILAFWGLFALVAAAIAMV